MEQATNVSPWILLAFNVLLALVSVFGGLYLRGTQADVKDLRMDLAKQREQMGLAERQLHDKLTGYVAKDEFREFRDEQRQNFVRLFDGIDDLKERLANKADRVA